MVRFRDDFGGPWICKNEQKCGSVCSKSFFGVRNIRSISGAFWARFWEGLGSILGGFFGTKSETVAFQSGSKSKLKEGAIKSRGGNFG